MKRIRIAVKAQADQPAEPESPLVQQSSKQQNLFGSDDSSDSETDAPVVRAISTIAAAQPTQPSKKPAEPELPHPLPTSGTKGSQIARLVARRKEAVKVLGSAEHESRDDALFKYDVDLCEEEADIANYERRPVEGFGEVMLRAMGWRGTEEKSEAAPPVPRPARLGLGAKLEDQPSKLSENRPRGSGKENAARLHKPSDASSQDVNGTTADSSQRQIRPAPVRSDNEERPREYPISIGRERRKRSRFADEAGR